MIRKVIKRFSISDPDNETDVIEFQSLVDLISHFKYNCMTADRQELKFYFFNQGVIEKSLR